MDIGKSLFYSLRPEHVFLVANTSHEVCVCKYHFNFIKLLESIHKEIPTIPKSHNELFKLVCCNEDSEDCMFGLCPRCKHINLGKLIPVGTDLTKTTHWKQWGDDENGRPIQFKHPGTIAQPLDKIMERLPKFKNHCYLKKAQSNYFEQCKTEIARDEAVIQLDFAEYYALVRQDEIQSAHWSHSQVTLFTCCVWLPNDVVQSYVVVSNDKSHSKYCVFTFFKAILEDVKILSPQIHKIYIFSDNCAGQFKSKFALSNLCFFETDFNLEVEWNFFASSHGKGAMDGIGGTVKRNVWTAVKSRTVNINNAKEFHEFVDQIFDTKIKSLYIDKVEVKENENFLNNRWNNVNAIVEVQSFIIFSI